MSRRTQPTDVAPCGSLRAESRTRIVYTAAEREGATRELVDLRVHDQPPLNAVDAEVPDAAQLRETIERADSLALGTPNYHGSPTVRKGETLD